MGKVIEVDGDYAILEMKESDACAGCGARSVCTAGKAGNRCMRIRNTLNAKIDDLVAFDTSETQQIQINLMQYGLPFLGFVIGLLGYFYLIAEKISFPPEIGAFAAGLLLMIGFGLITRAWSEKKSKSLSLHRMTKIVSDTKQK